MRQLGLQQEGLIEEPHVALCDHARLLLLQLVLTAWRMAMLVGPPKLGIQKKPLVNKPSSAALVNALQHSTQGNTHQTSTE